MAALHKHRRCDGCDEIKPIAGARGPRKNIKRFCAVCLAAHDAAQPTPIDLLAKALPHVPADLAEAIRQRISPPQASCA